MKPKFVIATTIPLSLHFFKGQIQILKTVFDVEVISSEGTHLKSICEQEEVRGHVVNMKREVSLLNDLKSLLRFIRVLKEVKPKIIHGSTPKAGFLSMLAGWVLGIKTRIYYLHGLRYDGLVGRKKGFIKIMERLSCYFATDIYAVSFGVKECLIRDGITKKEISVIGNGSVNGINATYYNPNHPNLDSNKPPIFEKDNFVYGFVGRLAKDKGINELVNCFIRLNKEYPSTRLLLVGDYEDLDPIDNEVKSEIERNKNIHFAGFQSDIRPLLKQMHVFVFPSYREGFGVSLMEALAMKVPAISSDIIGCNEIIEDRINGLLIPPKNSDKLYEAMEELFSNKELYALLYKNSREYVVAKYDQKTLWANTLESYVKLNNEP